MKKRRRLQVRGAADYIDFLKRAFGAGEISRSPGPGGQIMHALVRMLERRHKAFGGGA